MLSSAGSVVAAEAEPNALEEVVVTSRRVEERLQDVPLAVTALGADQLEKSHIKTTVELALFAPGLELSDMSAGRNDRGSSRSINFRGLSLANSYGPRAGALIFLDSAPVVGGEVGVSDDIERVEVLRGPQNVYFGRSTFSGAINYVTKPISKVWGGTLSAEVGNYSAFDVQASVGGPVIKDKLYVRLTARDQKSDGQYVNAFDPNVSFGGRGTKFYSATVEAYPFENFKAKLYVARQEDDDGLSAVTFLNSSYLNCAANPTSPNTINYYCGKAPDASGYRLYADTTLTPAVRAALFHPVGGDNLVKDEFPEKYGFGRHTNMAHLILNYETPFATLQSISAYHDDLSAAHSPSPIYDILGRVPGFTGVRASPYTYSQRIKDFSQELRLTSKQDQRFRWTAGGNYVKTRQTGWIVNYQVTALATTVTPNPRTTFNAAESYGLFAGGYFDILSNLTLSLEGRYQWDIRSDGGSTRPQVVIENTYKSFSPRMSLDYKVNPNLTAYASYARGTRPGGSNAFLLNASANIINQVKAQTGLSNTAYLEETLDTYEVGVKGSLFEGRVRGALAAYYGTLSDQQFAIMIPLVLDTGILNNTALTANVGRTRIKGFEAEAAWLVVPGLRLSGTFAWSPTEILQYKCTTCVAIIGTDNVNGNRLPLAPEYSGTLSAEYRHRITDVWEGYIGADYIYRGSKWLDVENVAETGKTQLINGRVGISNDSWMIEAFGTNLANDKTIQSSLRVTDPVDSRIAFNVTLPEKRRVGVRLRYRF